MKYILCWFSRYKIQTVLAPFFKMVETLFELTVPLIVADMVDRGITNGDGSVLRNGAVILVLLALGGLICAVSAQYFAAYTAVGVTAKTRRALFSKIQNLSFSELDRTGTSTLITRMTSDLNTVQNGINLTLRLFLRSPFIVFGAVVMAFTVNASAAWIFVVTVPVLAVVVFSVMLGGIPLYRRVQNRLDGVTRSARENLTGVRVIRAFGQEETETERFLCENRLLTAAQNAAGRLSALLNPVTYVLINLAITLLIYCGYLQFDAGDLTRGGVIALYNYMSQILVELVKLANLIITMTRAAACAGRIGAVMELPDEVNTEAADDTSFDDHAVSFDGVSLRYHEGGDPALTDIHFYADRGETVGIIGGTGSGKTTLVSLIGRFYPACEGRVTVFGRDTRAWDRNELRAQIGYVMQNAALFAGTVRENLLYGNPSADDAELNEALRAACADDFLAKKEGLDTVLEQGGRNLSGGQRQRLTIARALVGKKPILIFDDSTSALDYATDLSFRRALRDLPWHPTVFLVSQRTSSLRSADRILVLEDGEAVGCGTHDSLLETCGVYREIYVSQYGEGAVK